MENSELTHHGIKGQKWGVRRYQNPDGSLTPAGRKRYSEEYKGLMQKAQAAQARNQQRMMVDSYNETANAYNRGKIAEYNKTHSKDDPDYESKLNKQFEEDWHRNYTKKYVEFTKNDKNYQKGKALADKYGLYDYDDLAKSNRYAIESMENYVKGLITHEEVAKRVAEESQKFD